MVDSVPLAVPRVAARLQRPGRPRTGRTPDIIGTGTWVDLSHDFSSETIYWPTAKPFTLDVVSAQVTPAGYYYAANDFSTSEHGGTHLDAPVHFAEGKETTDQVPLDRLIGGAVVVDVSERGRTPTGTIGWTCRRSRRGRRSTAGSRTGTIVLVRTGWASRWPDKARYLGTTKRGPEGVAELHFPGIDSSAARWLRRAQGRRVGIDTPSLDYGQSQTYDTHRILFAQSIPGFENLASLDSLPATGAFVVALPMKIKGGSGGPLRIVALVPPTPDSTPEPSTVRADLAATGPLFPVRQRINPVPDRHNARPTLGAPSEPRAAFARIHPRRSHVPPRSPRGARAGARAAACTDRTAPESRRRSSAGQPRCARPPRGSGSPGSSPWHWPTPQFRAQVKQDLDRSPVREGKLHLQRYLSPAMRAPPTTSRGSPANPAQPSTRDASPGAGARALPAGARASRGLDRGRRASWSPPSATSSQPPVAFSTKGERIVLSRTDAARHSGAGAGAGGDRFRRASTGRRFQGGQQRWRHAAAGRART